MNRILTITLSALMLAGCANSEDKAALPEARAAVRQAFDGCKARLAAHDIKTFSEMASCNLAAERAYFAAVKLRNMDSFEAYAASYQTLAADRDANRISKRLASRMARQMLRDFYVECDCGPAQYKFAPYTEGAGTIGFTPNPPPAPPQNCCAF